jgi:pilus assembly protein Flp/PilA
METGMQTIRKFLKNNKGATAIEYGLIAALIAVAATVAMGGLGNQLKATFNNVNTKMGQGTAAA